MDRFLQNFTAAGIRGEIRQIATGRPLWAMTLWALFDDHADGPDGTRIYENSTVLVLRSHRGKIVEQSDSFVDTARLVDFDRKPDELGVEAVPRAKGWSAGAVHFRVIESRRLARSSTDCDRGATRGGAIGIQVVEGGVPMRTRLRQMSPYGEGSPCERPMSSTESARRTSSDPRVPARCFAQAPTGRMFWLTRKRLSGS